MLNELAKTVYNNAIEKGFYDDYNNIISHILNTAIKPIRYTSHLKQFELSQKLALIHSEISEALEAVRTNNSISENVRNEEDSSFENPDSYEEYIKHTFEDEIADVFIRLLDLCGFVGVDIDRHIELKMNYNKTREYKHGKEF